jgi:xylulokinase
MPAPDVLRIHLGLDDVTVTIGDTAASSPVQTLAREAGWIEQRPDDWWDAVIAGIAKLRGRVNMRGVARIDLSRELRGWVLLDGEREVIRPAILDGDVRIDGSPLPWLRQHEPIAYKRIQHILTPKSWLRFRLTGELVADTEDAADLGLLDDATGLWSVDRCEELEINKDLLSPLFAPGTLIPLGAKASKAIQLLGVSVRV